MNMEAMNVEETVIRESSMHGKCLNQQDAIQNKLAQLQSQLEQQYLEHQQQLESITVLLDHLVHQLYQTVGNQGCPTQNYSYLEKNIASEVPIIRSTSKGEVLRQPHEPEAFEQEYEELATQVHQMKLQVNLGVGTIRGWKDMMHSPFSSQLL